MNHESVAKSVAKSIAGAPNRIDELCRCAARLVESTRGPLKSLRLQSGNLAVELEWCVSDEHAAPLGPVAACALPEPVLEDSSYVVYAPLVGTFYRAPSPDAPPFVDIGAQVVAGQQLAIVEAMKLMNAVQVDRPGIVVDVLVTDGSAVEYGEALFVIAPV
jgi:acetyl-CoA carboxylase biotin carboxyl carrier protein